MFALWGKVVADDFVCSGWGGGFAFLKAIKDYADHVVCKGGFAPSNCTNENLSKCCNSQCMFFAKLRMLSFTTYIGKV